MDYAALTAKLLDTAPVSFLGSVDNDGFPAIRCMLRPRKRENIHTIWFSTNSPTHKVAHYRENPKACVYTYDFTTFQGVMLQGTMEVLDDLPFKKLLWQPGDDLYYPGGVEDPDYCVLRFTALRGRYYQNFHSENFIVIE